MKLSTDDPRLTAYVLGELDAIEAAAIEAAAADQPELQACLDEIRFTADLLSRELGADAVPAPGLRPEQREELEGLWQTPIEAPASPPEPPPAEPVNVIPLARRRWVWVAVPLAIAACLLLVLRMEMSQRSPASDAESLSTTPTHDAEHAATAPPLDEVDQEDEESEHASAASAPKPREQPAAPGVQENEKDESGIALETRPTVAVVPAEQPEMDPNASAGEMMPAAEPTPAPVAAAPAPPTRGQHIVGGGTEAAGSDSGATATEQPWAQSQPSGDRPARRNRPKARSEFGPSGGPSLSGRVSNSSERQRRGDGAQRELREAEPRTTAGPEAANRMGGIRGNGNRGRWASPQPARQPMAPLGHLGRIAPTPPADPAGEGYDRVDEEPFTPVSAKPLSTFSIDVDTASYSNVRRYLRQGQRPPRDAVRIEEMINYFQYRTPAPPSAEHPFSVGVEVAESPWAPQHRLVRVALRGKTIEPGTRPPANLVFLIDVSGSMRSRNKLPLVQDSLRMLVAQLDGDDTVAIVVYAGASGLVLPPTRGIDRGRILRALNRLRAGGSTNGGAGIKLAYQVAQQAFVRGGTNRVILATDGDFNVGVTGRGSLTRLIEEKARSGVFLTVLGYGMGNLQDGTLERIADRGNGNYAYIDNQTEARRVLVEQVNGTLVTIAKDVKIQVEFNPAKVAAYRLIGYENRRLAARDFNDDRKDAGEIGAGHTVVALYEIVPPGVPMPGGVDPLRYQPSAAPAPAAPQSEDLLTVKLRYKQPDGHTSRLIERTVIDHGETLGSATTDFKLAASVAGFGMLLRDSPHRGRITYAGVLELAQAAGADDDDPTGRRRELLELIGRARGLFGEVVPQLGAAPAIAPTPIRGAAPVGPSATAPGGSPAIGPTEAKVTVVLLADVQDPGLALDLSNLVTLQAERPGEVRLVMAHAPRSAGTRAAAAAVMAAHDQGLHWSMLQLLLTAPYDVAEPRLRALAARVGLNAVIWDVARNHPTLHGHLTQRARAAASGLQVPGRVMLFVNGLPLPGGTPLHQLRAAVASELAAAGELVRLGARPADVHESRARANLGGRFLTYWRQVWGGAD